MTNCFCKTMTATNGFSPNVQHHPKTCNLKQTRNGSYIWCQVMTGIELHLICHDVSRARCHEVSNQAMTSSGLVVMTSAGLNAMTSATKS